MDGTKRRLDDVVPSFAVKRQAVAPGAGTEARAVRVFEQPQLDNYGELRVGGRRRR